MSILQQQAAAELLRRRRARADPCAFAEYVDVPGRPVEDEPDEGAVVIDAPETLLAAHHRMILREVEECFLKDTGRLMIFMPPGSAKSTYASIVSPSYLMGKYKKTRCGVFSYADPLAMKMGRRTRSIITQPRYRGVFDAWLSAESSAVHNFTLTNGSEYMATGILGGATGNRMDIIFIDDPVKGREQADSQVIRDKTFDSYQENLLTRLVPGGSMCIIQCMVGSTLVLMADGSEKALRDVRPGDAIATYDDGRVSSSVIRKWANQGHDCTFKIRTSSGKIVSANERHPFLVERNGGREWVRLRNLMVGDVMLRVTPSGEHGSASSALRMAATSLPGSRANARPTTTNSDGKAATAHHQSTPSHGETRTSNTDTASPGRNTTTCSCSSSGSALSVSSRLATTYGHTGAENCASTIATTPARSEGCCATTATSLSVTGSRSTSCSALPPTYEIIPDEIVSIEPDGFEDVFDIEVERTENFIANGLVSHNTRWHEDDLSGRILPPDWDGESGDIVCRDGNTWRVLCLQAQCESDTDPLGRARGEMLWSEWFTEKHWSQFRGEARTWGALFQQIPKPRDGNMFNPDKIRMIESLPAGRIKWVRGWDLAATQGGGDYTAGPLVGVHQESQRIIIADVVRGQWGPGNRDEQIRNTVVADGRTIKQDFPDDPGAAGTAVVEYMVKKLKGYPVVWSAESGDKETRATPIAAEVNIGNVDMVVGDWNKAFKDEMRAFPSGTYDDQIDGLSRAYTRLVPLPGKMSISKNLLQRIRK